MAFCLHLDDVTILWEGTNRADFEVQSFIGFKAIIRDFRGFD